MVVREQGAGPVVVGGHRQGEVGVARHCVDAATLPVETRVGAWSTGCKSTKSRRSKARRR